MSINFVDVPHESLPKVEGILVTWVFGTSLHIILE